MGLVRSALVLNGRLGLIERGIASGLILSLGVAEIDTYSFGIVMWEVLHRTYPYEEVRSTHTLMGLIATGYRPTPVDHPDSTRPYSQVR